MQTAKDGNSKKPGANAIYEASSIINVNPAGRILSAAGGVALLYAGTRKLTPRNLMRCIGGAYLLYRGISGNCVIKAGLQNAWEMQHASSVNIRATIIVNRPRELVYNFWRRLDNLPSFMRHVNEVRMLDELQSHWIIQLPGGITA